MPSVTYSNTGIELSVDFEMYCKICGNGICNNTDQRNEHRDHCNVFVTYCDECEDTFKRTKDKVSELEDEVSDLITERDELKARLAQLEENEKSHS